MQITQVQFDRFQALAEEQANVRMVDWLKCRFPGLADRASDEQLMAFVQLQRLRARELGWIREDNFAAFLDFAAMYGPDFAEQAWAKDVMTSDLHGPDKVALLRQRVERAGVVLNSRG